LDKKPTATEGFTLIEIMVAVAILGILISGIVSAFSGQMRIHGTQQKVCAMQQNARAAMYYLARELRMAGYDPVGCAGTGIRPDPVASDTITFSMDVTGGESDGKDNDEDGTKDNWQEDAFGDGAADDPNEVITYALRNGNLTRASGNGSPQILAVNIDALNFEYFGLNPAAPSCGSTCRLSPALANGNPGNIRFIQVSIIAATGNKASPGKAFYDNRIYCNQQGKIILDKHAAPDNYRRILLTTQINLRNMGLKQ